MLKSYSAVPTHIIKAPDQWNLAVPIKADTLSSVSCGTDCPAVQIDVSKVIYSSSVHAARSSSAGSEVKGQTARPIVFPTRG